MAPSNQIQPLRRAQLAAAEFQVRGLRVSVGENNSVKQFNHWFKSLKGKAFKHSEIDVSPSHRFRLTEARWRAK